MNDWIVVGAYQNEIEALLAKGALDAAGIQNRARLNHAGDVFLGALAVQNGPTEILVAPKDAARAKKILKI